LQRHHLGEVVAQRQQHGHAPLGHLRTDRAAECGGDQVGLAQDGRFGGVVDTGIVKLDKSQPRRLGGGGQHAVGVQHLGARPHFRRDLLGLDGRLHSDIHPAGDRLDAINQRG
jgi:hypothetical protein